MFGNSTLLLMLVIVIVAFVAIILGLRFALRGPQKPRDDADR